MTQPQFDSAPGILVDDDEGCIREILSHLLEADGFRVFAARNGREAIEMYQRDRDRIQLALLDLRMPVQDGVETLRQLRALDPELPCCLWSGHATPEDIPRFEELGASRILFKPDAMSTIGDTMREVLNCAASRC